MSGFKQDPIDGVSFAYTFANAVAMRTEENAILRKQRQPRHLPRRLVRLHVRAVRTVGHAEHCRAAQNWDANKDVWQLYDLTTDFSQADDRSAKEPERLARMTELFLAEAKANKALPIGGGLWTRFHPEDVISSPYKSWRFDANTFRMPEFAAPPVGKRNNHVAIDVEVGKEASGVLYASGGISGGVTVYLDKGQPVYEYNMLIIERTTARGDAKLAAGKHRIEVSETFTRPGASADVVLKVRRQGGREDDGETHGPRCVHGERDARHRRRSRLAGVAPLFRSSTVSIQRQDREVGDRVEVTGIHPRVGCSLQMRENEPCKRIVLGLQPLWQ